MSALCYGSQIKCYRMEVGCAQHKMGFQQVLPKGEECKLREDGREAVLGVFQTESIMSEQHNMNSRG